MQKTRALLSSYAVQNRINQTPLKKVQLYTSTSKHIQIQFKQ